MNARGYRHDSSAGAAYFTTHVKRGDAQGIRFNTRPRGEYFNELLGIRVTLTEIAEVLGVSLSSVKRWKKAFENGGEAALVVKHPRGASSRLTTVQRD